MDRGADLNSQREPRTGRYESIADRVADIVMAAEREAEAARGDIAEHRRAAEQEARDYVAAARRRAEEQAVARAHRLEELSAAAQRDVGALARSVDALAGALRADAAPPSPREAPWREEAYPQPPTEPEPPRRYFSSTQGANSEHDRAPGPVPAPRFEPEPQPAQAGERRLEPDAARLMAIEMAVGGASRGEVERQLERESGADVPAALLDGVFGPDREATTRLSWGRP